MSERGDGEGSELKYRYEGIPTQGPHGTRAEKDPGTAERGLVIARNAIDADSRLKAFIERTQKTNRHVESQHMLAELFINHCENDSRPRTNEYFLEKYRAAIKLRDHDGAALLFELNEILGMCEELVPGRTVLTLENELFVIGDRGEGEPAQEQGVARLRLVLDEARADAPPWVDYLPVVSVPVRGSSRTELVYSRAQIVEPVVGRSLYNQFPSNDSAKYN